MKTVPNISHAQRKAEQAQSRRRNGWMAGFAHSTIRFERPASNPLSPFAALILKSILGRKVNP